MPYIVVDSVVGTWSYGGKIFANGATECNDQITVDAAQEDAENFDWLSVEYDVPESALDPVVEQDSGAVTVAELEGASNVCPECEKELATEGGLKNHVRIVHGAEVLAKLTEDPEAPESEVEEEVDEEEVESELEEDADEAEEAPAEED